MFFKQRNHNLITKFIFCNHRNNFQKMFYFSDQLFERLEPLPTLQIDTISEGGRQLVIAYEISLRLTVKSSP